MPFLCPVGIAYLRQKMRLFPFYSLCIVVLLSCEPPTPPAADTSSDTPTVTSLRQPLIDSAYQVAFLIMDGVYNTELTAPFDIFQHTLFREGVRPMQTWLVADTHDPVTTFEGIRVLPDFNYLTDSLPTFDILVIPSAEHHLDTDLENTAMLDFVRRTAASAQWVTSHCDGAFVLAKAGLLDGHVSTTFPSDIGQMRAMFPQLDVREDVLFVHDGKYITSAGGAKSFEAALYLCEVLYGRAVAQRLAQGLVIDWQVEAVPHLIVRRE